MNKQSDLGTYLKEEGIQTAVSNADRKIPGWSIMAMKLFVEFLQASPKIGDGTFMTEDVRAYALAKGLPNPPSKRAWGSIIVKAKKNRIIKFVGYDQVNNPKAHRANAARWRASLVTLNNKTD